MRKFFVKQKSGDLEYNLFLKSVMVYGELQRKIIIFMSDDELEEHFKNLRKFEKPLDKLCDYLLDEVCQWDMTLHKKSMGCQCYRDCSGM
jgi:hypothetical protein